MSRQDSGWGVVLLSLDAGFPLCVLLGFSYVPKGAFADPYRVSPRTLKGFASDHYRVSTPTLIVVDLGPL